MLIFVRWFVVVCEFVGDELLCCLCLMLLRFVWVLDGASPGSFVLSLFYLCAFQMNPVCVVTSY